MTRDAYIGEYDLNHSASDYVEGLRRMKEIIQKKGRRGTAVPLLVEEFEAGNEVCVGFRHQGKFTIASIQFGDPERELLGATRCHPEDEFDGQRARRIAFVRAVERADGTLDDDNSKYLSQIV